MSNVLVCHWKGDKMLKSPQFCRWSYHVNFSVWCVHVSSVVCKGWMKLNGSALHFSITLNISVFCCHKFLWVTGQYPGLKYICLCPCVFMCVQVFTHTYNRKREIKTKEKYTWGKPLTKATYFKVVWIKVSKLQSNSLVRTSSTIH